jgi:hypothetical protein
MDTAVKTVSTREGAVAMMTRVEIEQAFAAAKANMYDDGEETC